MRLRLVEDEEFIAKWLSQALAFEDVEAVFTTRDFERLLGPDEWVGIDAAVVDIMLSEAVSGLVVLEYLRDNHPHIRRIAMTAALPMAQDATGLAHQVLIKPFNTADLLNALET